MAKASIPFHTISVPGSLLGAREPCKLVDFIKGFNWLNYYGGKFSTSRGVGVFMDDALQLLPADYWRWYLLANAPVRPMTRRLPGNSSPGPSTRISQKISATLSTER